MKLKEILDGINIIARKGFANDYELRADDIEQYEVEAITSDSRKVKKNTLFVALRGTSVDGHAYIDKAIELGAKVIVCEKYPEELAKDVAYVKANNSYEMQGYIASVWNDNPTKDMKVVGVTGTNGKTTIATLLYRMFLSAGYQVGLVSTVCNYIGREAIPTSHTTPMALELQYLLGRMRSAGCEYVFMEVSSHSVAQHRITGIHFTGAIFTNLTRDHLDYHGTFAEYLKAKKGFFDLLPKEAFALTNLDDKNGQVMLQNCQARKYSYALRQLADYRAEILEMQNDFTLLSLAQREVIVRLVGEFNIYNLLAVYGTARLLGLEEDEALNILSELRSVDGRLETFRSEKRKYTAFVDYAHTPDALVNVLETLDTLRTSSQGQKSKIICVVGCGGDRDKGKRPLMASEAVRLSDQVIITSDNPRTEDPEAIIMDMKAGVPAGAEGKVLSIVNRSEAIRTACMLAREGDLVLVAGKGHETYQEINGVKYDFDDREVIKEQFKQE